MIPPAPPPPPYTHTAPPPPGTCLEVGEKLRLLAVRMALVLVHRRLNTRVSQQVVDLKKSDGEMGKGGGDGQGNERTNNTVVRPVAGTSLAVDTALYCKKCNENGFTLTSGVVKLETPMACIQGVETCCKGS